MRDISPHDDQTIIRVDARQVDLTYIDVPRFVRGYNGLVGASEATGRAMPWAFINTKNKLLRQGLIYEMPDGTIKYKEVSQWIIDGLQ